MKHFAFTTIIAFVAVVQSSDAAEQIRIDGSSTVFPVSEAIAEEYRNVDRKVRVGVGASGTGGGFKKFCKGETDISGASRPIKSKEIKACEKAGISFVELPVAYDGIAIVINKKNDWAKTLTTAELKKIWEPASKVSNWNQVRKSFPNEPLKLYGPGPDSGTFDYFTKAINGKERASRADYTASEDDNVLVTGVAGTKGALGYFGLAYYVENKNKIDVAAVATEAGKAGVKPNQTTVANGTYKPLSRPIYIYVSTASLKRPGVQKFMDFYLSNVGSIAPSVGYVSLGDSIYKTVKTRLNDRVTGSVYAQPNVDKTSSLETLLKVK